ncbi:hypothetical protein Tco_0394838 [Tanacetum coccineum]
MQSVRLRRNDDSSQGLKLCKNYTNDISFMNHSMFSSSRRETNEEKKRSRVLVCLIQILDRPLSSWDDLGFTNPTLHTTEFSARIMEMEPDIENMMLNKYLDKCEHDVDLEKEEGQVKDDDDGDTYNIWDITVEDVKLIRQFLTPNVPDEMDKVIQPLISQPIHTTPPNDDYVAPATKSILDELLEEFGDEILNVIMINKEADFNPTKDIKELERLFSEDPQSHFTKIQVPHLGCYSSYKKASHTGLVRCYTGDDELLESWMLFKEADLEHGLDHVVSSSYQANSEE